MDEFKPKTPSPGWFGGSCGGTLIYPPSHLRGISREELEADYLATLAMLVERATWRDRWCALRRPGHWLNVARRELFLAGKEGLRAKK
jgi:hypothetical protein